VSEQAITPRVIDWLLYNRRDLRALVEAMEPSSSTSLVQIPVRRRQESSQVECVAISRAAVSAVLDAVDRSLARLPKALRRLARLRYEDKMAVHAIARYVHWSERTCYRRLDLIRLRVESSLSLLEGDILAVFWQEIGRLLAA
jgi:DNA-directed RNA polymerase specialized sigma24 family protein